jgi:hypothetical protein
LTAVSLGGVLRRAAVTVRFRRGVTGFDFSGSARVVCSSIGEIGRSVLGDVLTEVSRARLVSGRVRSGTEALDLVVLTLWSR